jgi:hypothetical protein
MQWDNGTLTSATIRSGRGGTCRVRIPGNIEAQINGGAVPVKTVTDGAIEFDTIAGQVYLLKSRNR